MADWTDWWGAAEPQRNGTNWLIGPYRAEQLRKATPTYRRHRGHLAPQASAPNHGDRRPNILYLRRARIPRRSPESPEEARALWAECGGPLHQYLGSIYQRDADLLFETLRRLQATDAAQVVGDPGCRYRRRCAACDITGRLPFEHAGPSVRLRGPALPCRHHRQPRALAVKINEYVAVGRPTVACDVGGIASLPRS